jgi:23S rRNA (cytosine1962-C5)-methyltransferase
LNQPVIFSESGLRFEADVLRGQKTGFFLDQRENRRRVGSLARGRSVLNAFSFTGGFSVYAAKGGAISVTDLDISQHALEGGRRNFRLNQSMLSVRKCSRAEIKADAFNWLNQNAENRFSLIILDPPSLAKRESERPRAIEAYSRLASAAIKHLEPGGVLAACSCSAHVSAPEFYDSVRRAATRSRRKFTEIETKAHALDHPVTFKEADYLKAIYLHF